MRPDSVDLAEAATSWSGAYVHVPFCAKICPYCDFNVVEGKGDLHERFVTAVVNQIMSEPRRRRLDTVAFGGGTPTRLSPAGVVRILRSLQTRFDLAPAAEVSLEANPEDWTAAMAETLIEGGFNRVSFGAQSFDEGVLRSLGRLHTPTDVEAVVHSARRAGFSSINLDLMFGTPGESVASWRASLERALDLHPDHLSLYGLTVERGTALSRSILAGAPGPDEDDQAEKYELACARLEADGFVRYEISNFAKPDHACKYNLLTWGQGEYLGFGPGAHGHQAGERYRVLHRLEAYLDAVESGLRPEQGRDRATAWQREQERVMLGLRRAAGVIAGRGGEELELTRWGRRLFDAGVLARRGDRIALERPLLGDEAARAVLALAPVEC
jgi:oxygen-independent coproporphyrinogen-3 oxidase